MRVIDADKLKKDVMELWDYKTVDGITATTVLKQTITDIENQPTVKAIPIETIKKEIERLKEDIKWAWYYGNTALDKMEYLKMWLEIKLEDWEAERGADK